MSADILDLALGYPYPIPQKSYVIHKGTASDITADQVPHLRENRTPVLAVGSNQSPEQVIRKFPGNEWPPILCERCTVHDFDSVYSAHVTGYGSIASCLHPAPGTQVTLYINWLHEAHMDPMHATELGNENYVYAELSEIKIITEFGLTLDRIYFYSSTAGAYLPEGIPVPLAEIQATNRQWEALRQTEIQTHLQVRTAADQHFEEFVLKSVSDIDTRNFRKAEMRKFSRPFSHPGFHVIKS